MDVLSAHRGCFLFLKAKASKADLPPNKAMDKNGRRRGRGVRGAVFMWPWASFASPPLSSVLTRDHLEWDGATRGGLLKCCLALLCFSHSPFFPKPVLLSLLKRLSLLEGFHMATLTFGYYGRCVHVGKQRQISASHL